MRSMHGTRSLSVLGFRCMMSMRWIQCVSKSSGDRVEV